MAGNSKTLFLLDAYALIYRAHFAFTKNPRINSKGHNTSVPFGFTNTLMEVLQKQKPTHIAVAFDTAAPTFRDEIFEEYKATRQATPEDIKYGIPIVKDIIRAFNIPILEMDGFEADDIIGTIANKVAGKGFTVYMMTPDKDFGQLVTEKVLLYKPAYMGNSVDVMGEVEVCEKWDIDNVSQVIDMLGLQGDTSDNIPGIPGFGPKTASKLLRQYRNIEGIIKHADELKGKQKELVEEFGEQALLSRKLATIVTDVPVKFNEKDLEYSGPDLEKLKPIFDALEFKSMWNRLGSAPTEKITKGPSQLSMFDSGSASPKIPVMTGKVKTETLDTEDKRIEFITQIRTAGILAVDSMHDEAENFDHQLTGFFFSISANTAQFVSTVDVKNRVEVLKEFKDVLEDPAIAKVGHNIKPTILLLKKYNIHVQGPLFDTMMAHYLLEPEASHELDILSNQYLNFQFSEGAADESILAERVSVMLPLKDVLHKELQKRRHSKLMSDVEMPLVYALASMEFEGVKVEEKTLAWMADGLKVDNDKAEKKIYKIAGVEFNLNSPKQLGEVLFDHMKLVDKPKKTKTGQYATGEDVLLKLGDHEIVKLILEYRENEKLRSTYVEALPKMISQFDGRIHTDYRQAVAATGRLSSNNPNLQNIPIRTEKGRQVRSAFVPRDKDYLFMSADYSQIELRIAASFAKDEIMIEAFRNGRDIHSTTAAKVFKVPLEKVTPDMRRKAKEVNFGILYGSTAFGLSQNINTSRTEAAEIIEAYFMEFSAIKKYMDDSINQAREVEYVETILGRRRYLRDINSRNVTTRGFAERNAINAPIQGSAADIIKIAMVNIHRWMEKEKLKSRMIMQVHDELVFDLHKDEKDEVPIQVAHLMKSAVRLEVPMDVEVGVGKNWLEAH